MRYTLVLSGLLIVCLTVGTGTSWQQAGTKSTPAATKQQPNDEKPFQERVAEFTKAYNAGDAKGIAALFTQEAELIDDEDNVIHGRDNIEKAMSQFFAGNKGAQIEVNVASRRMVCSETVIEDGTTRVTFKDKNLCTHHKYMAVLVKREGKWLMASVRELENTTLSCHDRLKSLEWMVGDWVDEGSEAMVQTTTRWSADKNYLIREFTVKEKGKDVRSGSQRIGWDPVTNRLKAWMFDADGGHGESYWTQDGNRWIVKANGVSADGLIGSATYVLTLDNPNKLSLKIYDRIVGDKVEPDIEVTLVRMPVPK